MPDLASFMSSEPARTIWGSFSAFDDAETVGRHIAERPTSITVQRDGVADLAAQTVRIEAMSSPPPVAGGGNLSVSPASIMILGYKNHPRVANTNLRLGDRIFFDGLLYEVAEVTPNFADRMLARAEAKR